MATINGTSGDDTLQGTNANDVIDGLGGNDVINGGPGNDLLSGGTGDDTINGDDGNDFVDGGDGNDVIDGGPGDDNLNGNGGDDTIYGGSGNDRIRDEGGGINDRLYGGDGDDTIFMLSQVLIDGGSGSDELWLDLSVLGIDVTVDLSNPTVETMVRDTRVLGMERLRYFGGSGSDHVTGGIGDDALNGNAGNDVLMGGTGNDMIDGGDGDDQIGGGAGDDLLAPGTGVDILTGGSGNDTFWAPSASFLSGDTIVDFSRGDRIVIISATLENFALQLSGNQLSFTGGSLTLGNLGYASIAASAAPDGGVQITFSGPPIILSAGASVSSSSAAQGSQTAGMTMASKFPGQFEFIDHRLGGWHADSSYWEMPHSQADILSLA